MADLVLHNAKVYTVNSEQPWAEAIAIKGRWIEAVGDNDSVLALADDHTQIIDVEGRLILPGLCDAHIHFYDWALSRRLVPLADCSSKSEMMTRIQNWNGDFGSTGWIAGRGWNETVWNPIEEPTRHDLDQVTNQPAIFWRADMHSAVVNSAALELAGIHKGRTDPEGGLIERDANGEPNGVLRELAVNLVMEQMPKPDPAWLDDTLTDAIAELHCMGITAVHDQRMKDQLEGPIVLAAYQRLNQQKKLRLRINCNIAAHDLPSVSQLGLSSGLGDDYLRLGHIKLFTDGTLGSQTAWMLEPFEGTTGNVGINVTPPEQIKQEFEQAAALGFPISIHAIGDRANREVLDAFESLLEKYSHPHIPHRIEHVQTIHPDDLPRLAEMNLTSSVQPAHAIDDIELAEIRLGSRSDRAYNFHSLLESGSLLALGSDAPVANISPFLGFHAGLYRQRVNRMSEPAWLPNECLSLEHIIEGYTLGAAKAAGWQGVIGSIETGKRADMVVLDRDLFEVIQGSIQRDEIAGTNVMMTVFDGKTVFDELSG